MGGVKPIAPPSKHRAFPLLAVFLVATAFSLFLQHGRDLYDTDSYFHLAIARTYAEEGIVDELPALRFSLLREGFGDKEWLFHALLSPLAGLLDPLAAGHLALALFHGLLATLLGALGRRLAGPWALLLPFWLVFSSTELGWRLARLRPELLSLLLLLAALWAFAARRPRLLAFLVFLFTLGYTAFHALLGLVFLCFLEQGRRSGRWPWRLPLYATLGAGLALILHPHFPKNLEIWWAQNFHFFLNKGSLPVGTEIRPNFTDVVLMVHLGWFAGLAAIWRSATPAPNHQTNDGDEPLALPLAVGAGVFTLLYLLMSRFSLYAIPLLTLALLAEINRRGLSISSRVRLPGRGHLPLALALAFSLMLSTPEALRQMRLYQHRTQLGPEAARLVDRQALSAALTPGARVLADWGPTATYLLWAPQGRYLNALDPLFMALPHPEAHRRLTHILTGDEPDLPLAAAALDSDHLAFPQPRASRDLVARLAKDPRIITLYGGGHRLVRFAPGQNRNFLLDWSLLPDAASPTVEPAKLPPYPRAALDLRPFEGYVDGEKVAPDTPCVSFVRQWQETQATRRTFELAPYGPTTLWLDENPVASLGGTPRAILGEGLMLRFELAAGEHRLRVRTCEGEAEAYKGFFILDRTVRP